ncbi:MAG: AlpA family phage regulatory protein [Methylomicrobium sp.]|nr:AlpA family phage regulatory protein [Methylomicrobium sp.]
MTNETQPPKEISTETKLQPFVLPADGSLVRAYGIIGCRQRGIIGVCEMSRTMLWSQVNAGRFPKPLKIGRIAAWRAEDIREYLKDPENYQAR